MLHQAMEHVMVAGVRVRPGVAGLQVRDEWTEVPGGSVTVTSCCDVPVKLEGHSDTWKNGLVLDTVQLRRVEQRHDADQPRPPPPTRRDRAEEGCRLM